MYIRMKKKKKKKKKHTHTHTRAPTAAGGGTARIRRSVAACDVGSSWLYRVLASMRSLEGSSRASPLAAAMLRLREGSSTQ
jgi:hypothetical protein